MTPASPQTAPLPLVIMALVSLERHQSHDHDADMARAAGGSRPVLFVQEECDD